MKKDKKKIWRDLLVAFIIAVVVLGIVMLLTFLFSNQVKDVLFLDSNIVIITDIIGFVAVFFIAFAFLRSASKKEMEDK